MEFLTEKASFRRDTRDPFAEFQLNIMASFAQLERSISKERQAEGIKAAKARGVYKGRTPKLNPEQLAEARDLIKAGVPKARVARKLGIDRSTLYRALARTDEAGETPPLHGT